ncbi:MAG: hypothetical protein QOE90_1944 [Thermoplasmata archaeon]|jgi:hypothetical protein|nr:hypothetical protein [Thermoplasmata archaeon]
MKTILLLAAFAILATATLPAASADIVLRQCGPDVGCSSSHTYAAPGPSCTITLPAEIGRTYPLVSC